MSQSRQTVVDRVAVLVRAFKGLLADNPPEERAVPKVTALIWDIDDRGRTALDDEPVYMELDCGVPTVGDSINIAGGPVMVECRHWVSAKEVRLLCKRSTAMWPYGPEWEEIAV